MDKQKHASSEKGAVMHVSKFQASAVGNMQRHYERSWSRDSFERDNIDSSRTHLNYNCADRNEQPVQAIRNAVEQHNSLASRRLRKDAVRMADIVVTAPPNVPAEDLETFFRATTEFLQGKTGGVENCLGAYVHMDESTPHMHFSFMPRVDGKFNAKKLICRDWLLTLHDDLQAYLEPILGYTPKVKADDRVMPYVDIKDVDKMNKLEQEFKRLQEQAKNGVVSKDDLLVLKGKLQADAGFMGAKKKNEMILADVDQMLSKIDEQQKKIAASVVSDRNFEPAIQRQQLEQERVKKAREQLKNVQQPRGLKDRARNNELVSKELESKTGRSRRYR